MCRSMSAASRTSSAKLRKARVMGVRGSRDEAISPTVCEPMGSASGTAAAPYLPSRPPGEMFPRASSPPSALSSGNTARRSRLYRERYVLITHGTEPPFDRGADRLPDGKN
jgi:hypothetical protein